MSSQYEVKITGKQKRTNTLIRAHVKKYTGSGRHFPTKLQIIIKRQIVKNE